MVTVRTYASPVEAGLAKSILDDHEIFCALADEDTNRYSGALFAVPIRLLVREDQADQAICILNGDLEGAAKVQEILDDAAFPTDIAAAPEAPNNNPWELMAIATLFLFPGLCALAIKYPTVATSTRRVGREIAAVLIIHFLGWLAITFAVSLIVAYFYLRRSLITKAGCDITTRVG